MTSVLEPALYCDVVSRALDEDLGAGDVTSNATIQPDRLARGVFVSRSDCVVAGLQVALETIRQAADRVSALPSGSASRAGMSLKASQKTQVKAIGS